MNHIYRIVWNATYSVWQAVAENARSMGKGGAKHRRRRATPARAPGISALNIVTLAVLSAIGTAASAGPTGGQVSAGSASISQRGNLTTINQTSQRAAINWNGFSIGASEAVRFNQPNASAAILNRVTGREASSIMGSLSANGQVFIINPNGVLFGAGAQVNVGSLTATSLGLSDADFMANRLKFVGDSSTGSVINQGSITVAPGGAIAFMAPLVSNSGTLSAPLGNVLLAGAEAVTLTLQDGSPFAYTLDKGSAAALVENGGLIQAGGGHVILTAKGVDALSRAAVNHTGVIEAQTVSNKNGVIELLGDMQSGTVTVGGKLDASAPNGGDGGFVDTSAATVKILPDARVTTLAPQGKTGEWLIDPNDYNISESGGDITGTQLGSMLGFSNVNILSSSGVESGNGDINVKDAISWSANRLTLSAARDVNINAVMSATGSAVLALDASVSFFGAQAVAGGKVNVVNGGRVDFDRTGKNLLFINARNYTVINSLGTSGSRTGTDLQGILADPAGLYALGSNIDASATRGWNAGDGFAPLTLRNGGTLDGLGHVVNGLTIHRSSAGGFNVGLFGTVTQGDIRNLGLANVDIQGYSIVGGLAASFASGTISNSYVSGNVAAERNIAGAGNGVGGLIGTFSNGASGTYSARINNSYSTGFVSGRQNVGGLVGSGSVIIVNNSYSTSSVLGTFSTGGLVGGGDSMQITSSYSTGRVSGLTNVGGLIGQLSRSDVSNSYSAGNVSGTDYIGGLIGLVNGTSASSVINSYSTGSVSGSTHLGGLIGGDTSTAALGATSVTNSFWDTQTSRLGVSAGGIGKTTAQMQQQATFTGWDFTNTWRIVEGSSYPMLRAFTVGTLTLNAQARSTTKVYDGTPWVGGSVMDYSGFQNGDTTAILQGSIVWGGTAPGAVNAGTYSFIPSGLFSTKYEIVYGNGTLTVAPRPLNLTATKTFDASPSFAASQFAIGNVIGGDSVTLSGSATVPSANAGQYTSFATNNLSTANANYTTSGGNINATINQATLQLVAAKAVDANKVYGEADPVEFRYDVTSNPLGATFSGRLVRDAGEDVRDGGYAIRQGTLTAGNNFQLQFTPGIFTINPANLVISATSVPKIYDGTTSVTATPTLAAGTLFNNHQLTGGNFAYLNPNAGTGKAVEVSGVTVNDGNNGRNYSIRYANDQNGEVRQRPVDITVSKTYDTTPTFTQGFAPGNVIAGDTVAVTGAATVASADAGRYTGFAANNLTLNNPNYTLAGGRVDATINQATLQLVAARAVDANKVYGQADPEDFRYDVTSNPLGAQLSGKLVRDPGEDVKDGGYAIRQGTLTAGNNFQLQFTNGVFTIKPAGAYLWGQDYSITLGDPKPSAYTFRAVGVDGKEISTTNFTGVTISGPSAGQVSTIGAYVLPLEGGVSNNKNFAIRERYAGTLLVLPTKAKIELAYQSDLATLDAYREALNKNLPSSQQAGAPGSPWILVPFGQAVLHQDGIGAAERKFIHPDGREVVFDGDSSNIVTDARIRGTYNFGPDPLSKPHRVLDVYGDAKSNTTQFLKNAITGYLDNDLSNSSQPSPISIQDNSSWKTIYGYGFGVAENIWQQLFVEPGQQNAAATNAMFDSLEDPNQTGFWDRVAVYGTYVGELMKNTAGAELSLLTPAGRAVGAAKAVWRENIDLARSEFNFNAERAKEISDAVIDFAALIKSSADLIKSGVSRIDAYKNAIADGQLKLTASGKIDGRTAVGRYLKSSARQLKFDSSSLTGDALLMYQSAKDLINQYGVE